MNSLDTGLIATWAAQLGLLTIGLLCFSFAVVLRDSRRYSRCFIYLGAIVLMIWLTVYDLSQQEMRVGLVLAAFDAWLIDFLIDRTSDPAANPRIGRQVKEKSR